MYKMLCLDSILSFLINIQQLLKVRFANIIKFMYYAMACYLTLINAHYWNLFNIIVTSKLAHSQFLYLLDWYYLNFFLLMAFLITIIFQGNIELNIESYFQLVIFAHYGYIYLVLFSLFDHFEWFIRYCLQKASYRFFKR